MLDNVAGLEEALRKRAEVEEAIANGVIARSRALAGEQRDADVANERARLNAALAERARQQRHEDQSAVRDHEAQQLRVVLGDAPPAQPEPPLLTHGQPEEPPAPQAPTQVANHHPLDIRHWNVIEWVCAILGLMAGIVIARTTFWPVASFIATPPGNGFWRGLVEVGWWIAWLVLGFGAGGRFGEWLRSRHGNHQ